MIVGFMKEIVERFCWIIQAKAEEWFCNLPLMNETEIQRIQIDSLELEKETERKKSESWKVS